MRLVGSVCIGNTAPGLSICLTVRNAFRYIQTGDDNVWLAHCVVGIIVAAMRPANFHRIGDVEQYIQICVWASDAPVLDGLQHLQRFI